MTILKFHLFGRLNGMFKQQIIITFQKKTLLKESFKMLLLNNLSKLHSIICGEAIQIGT
jgi:hypothetical protein